MDVKKAALNVSAPFFRLFMHVFRNSEFSDIYMKHLVDIYESNKPEYVSMMKRPKNANDFISIEKTSQSLSKTAIILQGPLNIENNFTVETVKLYKKIFPGALVIVSTWDDSDKSSIEELSRIPDCKVLLNKPPQYSGRVNLNYQIVSTMAGMRAAKESGKEYVFKTRTDFRICKIGCIDFMVGLLEDYPLKEITYQKKRIILASNIRGSMFKAFWPGDQYAFGCTDDMLNYWNYDVEDISISGSELTKKYIQESLTQEQVENAGESPEVAIQYNYYSRMEGHQPKKGLQAFWTRLKNQYIIMSRQDLEIYWPKYLTRFDEAERLGIYYSNDSEELCLSYNWDFVRWYNLYKGTLKYEKEFEWFRANKWH